VSAFDLVYAHVIGLAVTDAAGISVLELYAKYLYFAVSFET